jgi:FKBP-type peptidyl-prolyl cis-trans isomerase FkpA
MMQKRYLSLLLLIIVVVAFWGCLPKHSADEIPNPDTVIESYLSARKLTAKRHTSGLYYSLDTLAGAGNKAVTKDTLILNYKGSLTDGTVFTQSAAGAPLKVEYSTLLPGLQVAVGLMRKGDKGNFYIPPSLGYGTLTTNGVPGNSVLIFYLELLDIRKPK